MKKIRLKFLIRMLWFMILVIGGMILIYNLFAEQFYIRESQSTMDNLYEEVGQMDITNLTDSQIETIEEYDARGFSISLTSADDKIVYYSSSRKSLENQTSDVTKAESASENGREETAKETAGETSEEIEENTEEETAEETVEETTAKNSNKRTGEKPPEAPSAPDGEMKIESGNPGNNSNPRNNINPGNSSNSDNNSIPGGNQGLDFSNVNNPGQESREYTQDAKAELNHSQDSIRLYGLIKKDDGDYHVAITIKVSTLRNEIDTMSKFMIMEMVFALLIAIPFSIYMAKKTAHPIEMINDMSLKMSNNELIDLADYKLPDDETGILAKNIVNMYNKITDNYIELNNYNYMLKNQNQGIIQWDKARKEFINKATHELKTPLAIISSQLEMLNMDHGEEISEYYDSMMEEIQKMSALIRDMLKSSFDKKPDEKVYKRIDFSKLLLDNKEKYTSLFHTKHIDLEYSVDSKVYLVMNEDSIKHAIDNYVMNAYEHTYEGKRVIISLKKTDTKAILSVFNEGNHIPEDIIDNIWDMYVTSNKDRADAMNVGLGLYIVSDIVNSHNGKCYAVNEENGVSFVMEFNL